LRVHLEAGFFHFCRKPRIEKDDPGGVEDIQHQKNEKEIAKETAVDLFCAENEKCSSQKDHPIRCQQQTGEIDRCRERR
jgi:hypothetical protein